MEEQRGARRKSTERRNTPAQRSVTGVLHYAASLPKGLPDMLPGWESRLDAKMTVERHGWVHTCTAELRNGQGGLWLPTATW